MTLTSKILMFVVVCLFAVGQTSTSAMACDHQMAGESQMLDNSLVSDMASMNTHAHHQMGQNSTEDLTQDNETHSSDCCGADCPCPAGVCASIAMADSRANADNFQLTARFLPRKDVLPSSAFATLYRPPILALA